MTYASPRKKLSKEVRLRIKESLKFLHSDTLKQYERWRDQGLCSNVGPTDLKASMKAGLKILDAHGKEILRVIHESRTRDM